MLPGFTVVAEQSFTTIEKSREEIARLPPAYSEVRSAFAGLLNKIPQRGPCSMAQWRGAHNYIVSDLDVIVFLPQMFHSESLSQTLTDTFLRIMERYGVQIDAEVPFSRKLLVPLEFLAHTAGRVERLMTGNAVPQIQKTPEYLSSDELLWRLLFNIMTTPEHPHLRR